jgi:hypothetical protein
VGSAQQEVAGRNAVTVYYRGARGTGFSYTIIEAASLPSPGTGAAGSRDGYYVLAASGRRRIVAWQAAGDLCILQSRSTGAATLLALARST